MAESNDVKHIHLTGELARLYVFTVMVIAALIGALLFMDRAPSARVVTVKVPEVVQQPAPVHWYQPLADLIKRPNATGSGLIPPPPPY